MDLTTQARVLTQYRAGGEKIATDAPVLDVIDSLITYYSALFERYMGRLALTATTTEQLDVDRGQQVFALSTYPVTSVTTVHADLDRTFGSGSLISSDDYYCNLSQGLLHLDYWALSGPGVLQVVYEGGMAATASAFVSAYPEIATAADVQIAAHLQRKAKLGAVSVSAGGGSVSHEGPLAILPTVRETLDAYRRVAIG